MPPSQAKSSGTKFNDLTLTCTWHNPAPSTSRKESQAPDNGEETNPNPPADDDANADDGLYNNVDDEFGGDVFGEEAATAPDNEEENVDYDYNDEADFVDFD